MNTEGPSADLTPDELPVEAPVVETPAAAEVEAASAQSTALATRRDFVLGVWSSAWLSHE